MMIAKADTLILRGGERMAQRLSSKPSSQLLALIADCEAELRSRDVIQSSNIVGDLAETLVCSALGRERLSRSAKYAQSVTKQSQSAISRRVNSPACLHARLHFEWESMQEPCAGPFRQPGTSPWSRRWPRAAIAGH